jgi:hypothetical protein
MLRAGTFLSHALTKKGEEMGRLIFLLGVVGVTLVLAAGVALAATQTDSQTTDGDTLTSTIKASTVDKPIVVTLTEDSRLATAGPTRVVVNDTPGKIKSITAPDFDCTAIGPNRAECARKEGNTNLLATIKIVAKPQGAGLKQNRAQDSYNNDIGQSFKVHKRR